MSGDQLRALRHRLNLTQEGFAERYQISYDSIRAWEIGQFRPNPSTQTLLLLIEREPEVIAEILTREEKEQTK